MTTDASESQINELKERYKNLKKPEEPVWRRYRTNDSTTEKLSELLNHNSRGMLVERDELTGLLSSWEKEGRESDRAFYLEAWNGNGTFYTDRIGRGTIATEYMCLSVFGGIQPAKLEAHLFANRLTVDGMFQRFQMIVFPDPPAEWKLVDEYSDKHAKNRAYENIKTLSEMNFIEYGAVLDEGDKIPHLHFTDDAQEVFYEWWEEHERKLRSDDEPVIIEHLAKYRKLMPALALIFHLIDIADGKATGNVSRDAAEKAAAWCDYLEMHARRIYGMVNSFSMEAAASLSRRIARGDLNNKFTVRDVQRHRWSKLAENEIIHTACDILVEKGWLKEVETPKGFQQKSKTEYHVNPKTINYYGKVAQ